jgi:hypothetical protein
MAGEATGWCLEAHDLVLAKCAAGRPRDWEFAEEAIRHRIVEPQELLRRVPALPLAQAQRRQVRATLKSTIARARGAGRPE